MLAGIPAASSAQDAASTGSSASTAFVGYQSVATGTALSAFPTLPALLPVAVPFEATLSLATATLSSGGQGFGRASSFFPGTLTTGLRPLIETAAGVQLPLPDYPLAVESREFEPAKHADVPGLTMTSDVVPDRATAVADVGALALPALVGVRSLHTESTTTLAAGKITATSTTTLTGIDVLGTVSIGSLVSVATVTSDGTHSTCGGGLTISGVMVAGTAASLDDAGLHVHGRSTTPGLGVGPLVASLLARSGVTARALGGIGRVHHGERQPDHLRRPHLPAAPRDRRDPRRGRPLARARQHLGHRRSVEPHRSPARRRGDRAPAPGRRRGVAAPEPTRRQRAQPAGRPAPWPRGAPGPRPVSRARCPSRSRTTASPCRCSSAWPCSPSPASSRVRRYMDRIIGVVGG